MADRGPGPGWWRWWAWLLLAVAALPLLAGPVWAGRHGWAPESDDAIVALRAHDTFSASPPVVGLPSTLGRSDTNTGASHPGPLEFWALSVPYALSGWSPVGLLVGIGLINLAAVAAIGWLAHRRGGPPLVAGAAVLLGFLCWGVGSEAVRSLWNPYIVLLPFVALGVAVGAVAADDPAGLVVGAAAGSFVLQTHLSYVGLVGLLGAWGIVAGLLLSRRARRGSSRVRPAEVRRGWRWGIVVLGLCWAVPVAQQFAGHPGNLSAVVHGLFASGGNDTAGAAGGIVAMGRVVGWPLVGLAPIGAQVWTQPTTTAAALLRWSVPWLTLGVLGLLAWRRRDGLAGRLLATAAVVLTAAFVTAWRAGTPGGVFYGYYVAWLWPCAVLVWGLIGVVAWRLLVPRRATVRRPLAAGAVATVAVAVALALPRPAGPVDQVRYRRLVRQLAGPVVDATHGQRRIVVVASGPVPFLSTRTGLMAVLDQHGHETRTSLGFHRKVFPVGAPHHDLGQPADATVWVMSGDERPAALDARLVGTADALDPADRRELLHLDASLSADLRGHGLRPTSKGRALLRDKPATERAASLRRAIAEPVAALHDRSMLVLADLGLVTAPGSFGRYERYSALAGMAGPDGHLTVWVSPGRPPGALAA